MLVCSSRPLHIHLRAATRKGPLLPFIRQPALCVPNAGTAMWDARESQFVWQVSRDGSRVVHPEKALYGQVGAGPRACRGKGRGVMGWARLPGCWCTVCCARARLASWLRFSSYKVGVAGIAGVLHAGSAAWMQRVGPKL